MIKCKSCGVILKNNDKICYNCHTEIKEDNYLKVCSHCGFCFPNNIDVCPRCKHSENKANESNKKWEANKEKIASKIISATEDIKDKSKVLIEKSGKKILEGKKNIQDSLQDDNKKTVNVNLNLTFNKKIMIAVGCLAVILCGAAAFFAFDNSKKMDAKEVAINQRYTEAKKIEQENTKEKERIEEKMQAAKRESLQKEKEIKEKANLKIVLNTLKEYGLYDCEKIIATSYDIDRESNNMVVVGVPRGSNKSMTWVIDSRYKKAAMAEFYPQGIDLNKDKNGQQRSFYIEFISDYDKTRDNKNAQVREVKGRNHLTMFVRAEFDVKNHKVIPGMLSCRNINLPINDPKSSVFEPIYYSRHVDMINLLLTETPYLHYYDKKVYTNFPQV